MCQCRTVSRKWCKVVWRNSCYHACLCVRGIGGMCFCVCVRKRVIGKISFVMYVRARGCTCVSKSIQFYNRKRLTLNSVSVIFKMLLLPNLRVSPYVCLNLPVMSVMHEDHTGTIGKWMLFKKIKKNINRSRYQLGLCHACWTSMRLSLLTRSVLSWHIL